MDASDSYVFGSVHILYILYIAGTGSLYRAIPSKLFGSVSASADISDALSDILQN